MKTSHALLRWIPRSLSILMILFIIMFSFDVFEGNEPLSRKIIGFLMHNIPAFILIAVLIIAWFREYTGGLIYIVAGIAFSIFLFIFNYHRTNSVWVGLEIALMLGFPFIIAGLLFIFSHRARKRLQEK